MADLEHIPPEEAAQIEHIVRLTIQQLQQRYSGEKPVLRGVHPKDHGCVQARFTVHEYLAEPLRVGVFAVPGKEYQAWIRFSNADVLVRPDTQLEQGSTPGETIPKHGSRGMAIKLLGVTGVPLVPAFGPLTQDFLLINQPVFAFANAEDYEVVSRILVEDNDKIQRFFQERIRLKPDRTPQLDDPATVRALRTARIIKRIQNDRVDGPDPAFQPPMASPVEARYFSAAPFLFGPDQVAKFSARPLAPSSGKMPDATNPDYLRAALLQRLTAECATDVTFEFQVQVRAASELADKIDSEIEDACQEWPEQAFPFVPVATITIPPQPFDSPERRAVCERLFFTPWHGLQDHRPLGSINRLRRAVYEASGQHRLFPKEPARL